MKAIVTRYLNELVGLTIMALMLIALIAAQAGALADPPAALADQAADGGRPVVEINLTLAD
ncbi:MAG: hypothetical protein WB812_07120 [Woeseiaceae bacterium]